MIIGVSGYMASGKTTVANIIKKYLADVGVVAPVCSFATPIKKAAQEKYGRKGTREENQQIGDEMRAVDPDCIVKAAMLMAKEEAINGFVIFDDVRKRNEYDAIRQDGYVIRLVVPDQIDRIERIKKRDGITPDPKTFLHNTETELDGVGADYIIMNGASTTMEKLEAKVLDALLGLNIIEPGGDGEQPPDTRKEE